MNSNPLRNGQVSHEEAVLRFLARLNADTLPKRERPEKPACVTTDQLISLEAAEALARWFRL
jgi:hypothetical protein